MNELIGQVTQTLGLSQGNAESAVGTVLGFLRQKAGGPVGDALGSLPGAGPLLAKAQPTDGAAAPAGGLGGLLGAAGGMLGGGAGGGLAELAPLLGGLSRSGLDAQSAMKLLPLVLRFIQPLLGPDKSRALLSAVPALQGLLGGAGGASASPGLGDMAKGLGKLF